MRLLASTVNTMSQCLGLQAFRAPYSLYNNSNTPYDERTSVNHHGVKHLLTIVASLQMLEQASFVSGAISKLHGEVATVAEVSPAGRT